MSAVTMYSNNSYRNHGHSFLHFANRYSLSHTGYKVLCDLASFLKNMAFVKFSSSLNVNFAF